MFTGREKELQYLNDYYVKPGTQILVGYGQKGIGKTTLLEQFVEDKDCLYYEAISCSTRQQRVFMGKHLEDMGITVSEYPEFEELFSDDASTPEVVTTFQALLELLKHQFIIVEQEELFATITIKKNPNRSEDEEIGEIDEYN